MYFLFTLYIVFYVYKSIIFSVLRESQNAKISMTHKVIKHLQILTLLIQKIKILSLYSLTTIIFPIYSFKSPSNSSSSPTPTPDLLLFFFLVFFLSHSPSCPKLCPYRAQIPQFIIKTTALSVPCLILSLSFSHGQIQIFIEQNFLHILCLYKQRSMCCHQNLLFNHHH